MSEIGMIQLVFLLLLVFIVGFGLLARKIGTPYPIVMVIGGLILGFIPGIPQITLDPDLIFLVVLPPLLYSSAWTTSWRDFRHNLVSIILLAFGLVTFTVVGVALVAPFLLKGFDWRLGLVLGAIVAPTDAIAAASIARRVGLPARIIDILEGESLLNDASGLLALQFAIAIVVSRRVPTITDGVLTLAWLVIGGIGLGLLTAWIVERIENQFDDGPIESALSILVPYAVYLAADRVHASGVLAVVACGLYLSRRSAHFFSPAVRIEIWSFWQPFTFMLNGLVFVLIGLQLKSIWSAIGESAGVNIMLDGAIFSVVLILLRLIWTFPAARVAWFLRSRFWHQNEPAPTRANIFVVGWTGMRGVVSLAAALALPSGMENGSAFPQRNLLVFLTFCVIFVTLVLQGISLPLLIRRLGLAVANGPNSEEQEARRIVLGAALSHLDQARNKDAEWAELYDDLKHHYEQRLASLQAEDGNEEQRSGHSRFIALSRETRKVERDTAINLRNEGRINDEVLRRIERELDLMESRYELAADA